jgi:hypothetical protein
MVLRKMQIVMCPPHAQPPGFFLESNPLYIQLKWTPTLQNREENKAVGLGLHSSHYLLRLYIHGLRWIDLHMLWSGSGTIQNPGPSGPALATTCASGHFHGAGLQDLVLQWLLSPRRMKRWDTAPIWPNGSPRYCTDMAKWITEERHFDVMILHVGLILMSRFGGRSNLWRLSR